MQIATRCYARRRPAEIKLNPKWPASITGRSIDCFLLLQWRCGCKAEVELLWVEEVRVWGEDGHEQMALIGNMSMCACKIATVWPGRRPSHWSLWPLKPREYLCSPVLHVSSMYADIWSSRVKSGRPVMARGDTQHVTASQAWRDDVISVLLLSVPVKFYIAHLLFIQVNHY